MNFFLATYTLRIYGNNDGKSKAQNSRPLTISDFNDKKSDIYSVCRRYLAFLRKKPIIDDNSKCILKVTKYKVYQADRVITGIFETGYYGLSSNLIDVETNTYRERKSTEADAMPFFFLFYLPENMNEGIIILQRIGNRGIKGLITEIANEKFPLNYDSYRLEINSLIPEEVVRQIIDYGIVKKLRFTKFQKHSDKSDILKDVHFEKPVTLEFVIAGNHLNLKDKILAMFNKGSKIKSLFELNNDFEYDTIKTEILLNDGRRRIINLSNFMKICNYVDITQELEFNPGGHPKFKFIESSAFGLYRKTKKQLYS